MNSNINSPYPFNTGVDDIKHLICIGMLGINDADRILVKAYFRLTLRLDYDISWVAANDPNADLLLINRRLSDLEKTQKFIQTLSIPILYVESSEKGKGGGFNNDVLRLPLIDTQLLQQWLLQHVAVLAPIIRPVRDIEAALPPSTPREVTPPNPLSITQYITDFSVVIQTLQLPRQSDRQSRYLTLYDQHRLLIGVADTVQQQFWIQQAGSFKLTDGWFLKCIGRDNDFLHPNGTVVDLKQWLWDALSNAKSTTTLVTIDQLIHLKHWPKPQSDASRRQVLRVLALLAQQPMSIKRLSQTLNLSVAEVHMIVGSLYGSGCATLGTVVQDWDLSHEGIAQVQRSRGLRNLLSSLRNSLRL